VGALTETGKAAFLSYASQDAEAAKHLCDALRTAGVEVWFDQSELRGGDTWDASIRRQIKNCALFIPVISRNTHARDEGYFRLEWKLAVDRSHLMTANRPFLVPVVIDDASNQDEQVPDRFREVQWTRLPEGANTDAFVEHVRQLLTGEPSREPSRTAPVAARVSAAKTTPTPVPPPWRSTGGLLAMIAMVVLALGYLAANRFVFSKHGAQLGAVPSAGPSVPPGIDFHPPSHSIAVLPFVNMSGDKEQEYFSDGLTEELLNSLARINELQVAARTSAFSFKGKDTDIGAIARKLNVGAVLEGSVRRSGHTVRINAELVSGITGFQLWSQTYDRNLGEILALQSGIANAVASALKVNLLGDVAAKVELGGTRNPAAFDAYLLGRKADNTYHGEKDSEVAIAEYTEAIHLDPKYALAFADRSIAMTKYSVNSAIRENMYKAQADGLEAIELAPNLAEGHLALATNLGFGSLDFIRANAEFRRALALAPGNVKVLRQYSQFAALMGQAAAAIAAGRHAVLLDPLSYGTHDALGFTLYYAHQYGEAVAAYQQSVVLDPGAIEPYERRGFAQYAMGSQSSARESCEVNPTHWYGQVCLAIVYDKLGRHTEARETLDKLAASRGDLGAYLYADIYAQWGDNSEALTWLETALRLRDPGLAWLKADPLLDPLRKEPRYIAIERALRFPT
jgi:TolB-like protein